MIGDKSRTTPDKFQIRKIDLDITIDEFLDLPEFIFRSREWTNKSLRVITGLYYGKQYHEMTTLRDLKNYVEKNGWLGSRAYKIALLDHMGEKTIKYFNQVLNKYCLDSFGPLIKR